jgi:fatty acid desaturase
MEYKINHLAVWLLVLIQQGIGALWYSSLVFGKKWMTLQGKSAFDLDKSDPIPFVLAFIAAVALTYFMAWLINRLNLKSVGAAIIVAVMVWFCTCFFERIAHDAFGDISIEITLIDMGQSLLKYVLIGVGLGAWKKKVFRFSKR